jgi:hypothetical protein
MTTNVRWQTCIGMKIAAEYIELTADRRRLMIESGFNGG